MKKRHEWKLVKSTIYVEEDHDALFYEDGTPARFLPGTVVAEILRLSAEVDRLKAPGNVLEYTANTGQTGLELLNDLIEMADCWRAWDLHRCFPDDFQTYESALEQRDPLIEEARKLYDFLQAQVVDNEPLGALVDGVEL